MTDKEKLDRMKKLADAMYHAAQYLTTDASKLHKAMEDYHQFIINDYCKEEPESEDLEEATERYACKYSSSKYGYAKVGEAFKAGAQWQREQMKEVLQTEYGKGRYDMREELMHDDKFLKAIGDTYVEWIEAGINTNDVDPADYIRDHLFD